MAIYVIKATTKRFRRHDCIIFEIKNNWHSLSLGNICIFKKVHNVVARIYKSFT